MIITTKKYIIVGITNHKNFKTLHQNSKFLNVIKYANNQNGIDIHNTIDINQPKYFQIHFLYSS